MISTLFFILFIAFQFWYLTSKQIKHTNLTSYELKISENSNIYRLLGGILFLIATAIFILTFGWMSGISACIVGLMGVGSLIVLLAPFKYMSLKAVSALYILFVILEIFI